MAAGAGDTLIRLEAVADVAAVRRVNEAAFAQPDEGRIVDAIRAAGAATLSLVAVTGDTLVGHILFSPVTIATPAEARSAVGLAPMAVLPELQRCGIGSLLVRAGLERLRRERQPAVVVLGHPTYYPRFGFVPASRFGLRWELDCPDEAFMALELIGGSLAGLQGGVVRYRPELSGAA